VRALSPALGRGYVLASVRDWVLGSVHELPGAGGGTIGITARASARMATEIGAPITGGKSGTSGGVSETGAGGNARAAAVEN